MFRTLLVGINIIGIALLGFFQKSDPEITHDIPASMEPGTEQVVTFNLEKSDITGFAKFQIELSPGLTAEVVKSEGASFTFNNQAAKFIWMALPSAKNMEIQIRLMASTDAAGPLQVKSRFSYIYANERKNIDVPVHIVAVGEALAVVETGSPGDEELKNLNAAAIASRTVTPEGVNQWRVEIAIEKSTLQGFAKVEETVPSGFTVVDLKSSSAVFSVDNQTVKYIWYDIPENDVVIVSYKMLPVVQMENNEPDISGAFSFLKDEETVTLPILDKADVNPAMLAKTGKDTIEAEVADIVAPGADAPQAEMNDPAAAAAAAAVLASAAKEAEVQKAIQDAAEKAKAAEMAANTAAAEAEQAKVAQEAKAALAAQAALAQADKEAKAEAARKASEAKQQAAKASNANNAMASNQKSPNDGNIVNVPDPERGIFYRVQIAAGKNNLNSSVFAKLYGFDEGFKLETASGLLKYTTGYHQVYKSARNDRERISSKYEKFQGPFVAAYNDGERITVQEALMVSSQKWVP